MEQEIEMKPCPFCGDDRIYVGEDELKRPYYYCRSCFARTDSRLDAPSALALWNERAETESYEEGYREGYSVGSQETQ